MDNNMDSIILYFVDKYKSDGNKIMKALEVHETMSQKALDKVEAKYKGIERIAIQNDAYPDYLKEFYKPPFMIFLTNGTWVESMEGNSKMFKSETTNEVVSTMSNLQTQTPVARKLLMDSLINLELGNDYYTGKRII